MKGSLCGEGKRLVGPIVSISVDRAQHVTWMKPSLYQYHQITVMCVQVYFQFTILNKFFRLEQWMQAIEGQ